jgi:ABC-type multidrug transport system fused ATPase/permease subunit
MIAHRLSTIHRAHRIAVLEEGALVELGPHADLLALDGLYARVYRMQFKRGDIGDASLGDSGERLRA